MRKTISIICSVIISAFISFGTVQGYYTSIEAANYLADHGIIVNNSNHSSGYRLGATITRKEVAKIIMNLSKKNVSNYCEGLYYDFPKYDWGCKYAEAGQKHGFFSKKLYFNPETNISKWESLKMIMKAGRIPKAEGYGFDYQRAYMVGAFNAGLITKSFDDFNLSATRGWILKVAAQAYIQMNPQEEEVVEAWDKKRVTMTYKGRDSVIGYISKPEGNNFDVVLALHGTTGYVSEIENATKDIVDNTEEILEREDVMIIGVVYRAEGILIGDNVVDVETALLWTRNSLKKEYGVDAGRIFVFGHSQGGYLATRLNTMHVTNGVIVNGAELIDLNYRCEFEETGQIEEGIVCGALRDNYGTTFDNPEAYQSHSMISFTDNYKSEILFIQGMGDKQIQLDMWSSFKEVVEDNLDPWLYEFLEIKGAGHEAVFESKEGREAFNYFIQ